MFQKKEFIYSETMGVCHVDDIARLSPTKHGKLTPYYVLRSVYEKGKVAYIPVENHEVKMRELITYEEAQKRRCSETFEKEKEHAKQEVEYVIKLHEKKTGTPSVD